MTKSSKGEPTKRQIQRAEDITNSLRELDPVAYDELGRVRDNWELAERVLQHLETNRPYRKSLHHALDQGRDVALADLRRAKDDLIAHINAHRRCEAISRKMTEIYRRFCLDHAPGADARLFVEELQRDLKRGTESIQRMETAVEGIDNLIEYCREFQAIAKAAAEPQKEVAEPAPQPLPAVVHKCECGKTGYTTDDEGVWWCKKHAYAKGLLDRPKIEEAPGSEPAVEEPTVAPEEPHDPSPPRRGKDSWIK